MTVAKTTSASGGWLTYLGTYQEVIDALDAEKIPAHKVRGFSFTATGNCLALVNKH